MKKSSRTRVAVGVALVVVLALSHVHSALAITCAANTWYPGSGGTASSCTACPAGTTAAATPDHTGSRTFCEGIDAGYYGTAGNTNSGHAIPTACPTGTTNAAATSTKALETCFAASKPSSVPSGAGGFFTVAGSTDTKYYVCKAGTTAASIPANANSATFCGGIAAGYYGTASSSAHATPTACTATFSHSSTSSGAITSDASTWTTAKTACKTAPGYIIASNADVADGAITVAKAAAGTYAAGGTALVPGRRYYYRHRPRRCHGRYAIVRQRY